MSDQLLVVLRVCLLALVYLVFLRVLRAVWVELRTEQALISGLRRSVRIVRDGEQLDFVDAQGVETLSFARPFGP